MPVPTAVPPCGRRRTRFSASVMRSMFEPICAAQPPSSWPNVTGIASIRCVRPVLATFLSSRARCSSVFFRCASAGSSFSLVVSAALTWIAVGITSFDDCPLLTSSFGCTFAPAIAATCAMTSFAFMFDDVPEPVWNTSIGKCAIELAGGDPLGRLADRLRVRLLQMAEIGIRLRGGGLDQAERANELARHRQAGNREIVDRALGLRAVERVGGHLEFAHAVALDPVLAARLLMSLARETASSTIAVPRTD